MATETININGEEFPIDVVMLILQHVVDNSIEDRDRALRHHELIKLVAEGNAETAGDGRDAAMGAALLAGGLSESLERFLKISGTNLDRMLNSAKLLSSITIKMNELEQGEDAADAALRLQEEISKAAQEIDDGTKQ